MSRQPRALILNVNFHRLTSHLPRLLAEEEQVARDLIIPPLFAPDATRGGGGRDATAAMAAQSEVHHAIMGSE